MDNSILKYIIHTKITKDLTKGLICKILLQTRILILKVQFKILLLVYFN